MTTPRVNVGTKGHCDHGINPMKAAFEAWYDNDDISEPLPDDYTILGKRYLYMGWKAAKTHYEETWLIDNEKKILTLEGEVAELKDAKKDLEKEVIHLQEMNEPLQANNHDLREAIETALYGHGNDALPKLRKALSSTPAESLQAHDDEVIASITQSLTDPENQPSQFGTVPLEWYENLENKLEKVRFNVSEVIDSLDGSYEKHAIRKKLQKAIEQ